MMWALVLTHMRVSSKARAGPNQCPKSKDKDGAPTVRAASPHRSTSSGKGPDGAESVWGQRAAEVTARSPGTWGSGSHRLGAGGESQPLQLITANDGEGERADLATRPPTPRAGECYVFRRTSLERDVGVSQHTHGLKRPTAAIRKSPSTGRSIAQGRRVVGMQRGKCRRRCRHKTNVAVVQRQGQLQN